MGDIFEEWPPGEAGVLLAQLISYYDDNFSRIQALLEEASEVSPKREYTIVSTWFTCHPFPHFSDFWSLDLLLCMYRFCSFIESGLHQR